MTTYLEKFQADFEAATESYVADVANIQSQYDKAQQRLAVERGRIERAEAESAKLKDRAGQSLSGERGSYDKFKSSLRRLQEELSVATDAAAVLDRDVLPNIQAQLAEAKSALEKAAGEFFAKMRSAFEARLQELFGDLLTEADDYFGSCRKLAESAGVRYLPRSLAADIAKIDKYCLRVQEDRVHLGLLPHSSWPKT